MVAVRPIRLIDQVSTIRLALTKSGVQLTDMSRAGSLEQGLADVADLDHATESAAAGPVAIVRLEGPILARQIAPAPPGASRFRYFLDGSQKSIPVGRIDLDPIVVALSASGILVRDDTGQPRLIGESLRVNQNWIIPLDSGNLATRSLIDEITGIGGTIHDPFHTLDGNPLGFESGNYARTLRSAFDLAGRLRAREELALINLWTTHLACEDPESWLVIDGPLRGDTSRAVGLVKSLQTQQLAAEEAVALFNLPPGNRTSAFRYVNSTSTDDATGGSGKTMWYMRLWSAIGMDARHSLVRIETTNDITTSDQIDEISSWILAERLPRRPTIRVADPSLSYPLSRTNPEAAPGRTDHRVAIHMSVERTMSHSNGVEPPTPAYTPETSAIRAWQWAQFRPLIDSVTGEIGRVVSSEKEPAGSHAFYFWAADDALTLDVGILWSLFRKRRP
jgi:hypothetical protein